MSGKIMHRIDAIYLVDVEIGQPMSIKEWENIMTIQGIWSRPV